MAYLNRNNEVTKLVLYPIPDIKGKQRPKALTGIKQFYFERLEYLRVYNEKWYPFLLKKYLKRLTKN